MRKILRDLGNLILDTLFPIKCIGCQKEGFWICEICLSKISIQTEHLCGVCEKYSTPDGRTCLPCKKKSPLDGLISAASYKDQSVSHAIHLFKYRFAKDLHEQLATLMIKAINQTELPIPNAIIPIPLHARRMRWRGFNQSLLLAKTISENLLPLTNIPLEENILIRHRYTQPQMHLTQFGQRKQNISGAFSIRSHEALKNKTILLVDDVATTGSTIFECAKILKAAGAKEVFAVVIARQQTSM